MKILFLALLFPLLSTGQTLKDVLGITSYMDYGRIDATMNFKLQRYFVTNATVDDGKPVWMFQPTKQNFKYDVYLQKAKDLDIKTIYASQGAFSFDSIQGKTSKVPCLKPGADPMNPASWIDLGKLLFNVAARYGNNKDVPDSLITLGTDNPKRKYQINKIKKGTDLLWGIEVQNEYDFPSSWSKGPLTLSPEQYAVCFSVAYDGHMGTLGSGIGIRNADPNIAILMGGQMSPDTSFTRRVLNKLKEIRGSVPKDIYANFHWYMRSGSNDQLGGVTGITPEDAQCWNVCKQWDSLIDEYGLKGWLMTECGWETFSPSKQQAPDLQGYTMEESQGICIFRTALIFATSKHCEGITFWHCRDNYDAHPYQNAGINHPNWSPKPARIILEDYLSKYKDYRVSNFREQEDLYIVDLIASDTISMAWTNKMVIGNFDAKPKEYLPKSVPVLK